MRAARIGSAGKGSERIYREYKDERRYLYFAEETRSFWYRTMSSVSPRIYLFDRWYFLGQRSSDITGNIPQAVINKTAIYGSLFGRLCYKSRTASAGYARSRVRFGDDFASRKYPSRPGRIGAKVFRVFNGDILRRFLGFFGVLRITRGRN